MFNKSLPNMRSFNNADLFINLDIVRFQINQITTMYSIQIIVNYCDRLRRKLLKILHADSLKQVTITTRISLSETIEFAALSWLRYIRDLNPGVGNKTMYVFTYFARLYISLRRLSKVLT